MYSYLSKESEVDSILSQVFNRYRIDYEKHPRYNEFLDLLHSINEVLAMYVGKKGTGRDIHITPFFQSISENFLDVEQRMLYDGYDIFAPPVEIETHKYWTHEHFNNLYNVKNMEGMLSVAFTVLENANKYGGEAGQICGPITTGGSGDVLENLKVFNCAIQTLSRKEYPIFDQMPFEPIMQTMFQGKTYSSYGGDHDHPILKEFYRPLFKSGLLKTIYFTHNWESSTGSRVEHDMSEEFGLDIVYLKKDFIPEHQKAVTV